MFSELNILANETLVAGQMSKRQAWVRYLSDESASALKIKDQCPYCWSPLSPLGPWGPFFPLKPRRPCGPLIPALPLSPFSPLGPSVHPKDSYIVWWPFDEKRQGINGWFFSSRTCSCFLPDWTMESSYFMLSISAFSTWFSSSKTFKSCKLNVLFQCTPSMLFRKLGITHSIFSVVYLVLLYGSEINIRCDVNVRSIWYQYTLSFSSGAHFYLVHRLRTALFPGFSSYLKKQTGKKSLWSNLSFRPMGAERLPSFG